MDITLLFARYRDAIDVLESAMNRQTRDRMRLRVADAEVEIAEVMFSKAEEAILEYNDDL